MINFTVGPVQESDEVLAIGGQRTPYFRNQSFSTLMLENESMMIELARAPKDARVVFLTASGTGAMEAAVMNSFDQTDRVLVVNGGGFGHRFAELCAIHQIPYTEIHVPMDESLTAEMLMPFDGNGYTGFLINMHETSIGKLYDMKLVSDFCKRNGLFLVVDAVSAFLADEIDMAGWEIDVLLTGSQKALATPPGVSIIVMAPRAVKRINGRTVQSMYFDIKDALKNGERGQTPFTPAVNTLRQIHSRMKLLVEQGVETETARIADLAADFRQRIMDLPFEIASPSLSNAVTPLFSYEMPATQIFETLERDYDIWICPNGGELKDKLFRVGHLGALTIEDNIKLVQALREILHTGR